MGSHTVDVTRYIIPLHEGGFLPALAETDNGLKYVVKFRSVGHGTRAPVAELIGGEITWALGFRLPESVFLNLDEVFGRLEGDKEIQDLLQGSRGLNLGLHFFLDALPFDPVVTEIDGKLASQVVWLDTLLANVDRTTKNANMLTWYKELWLIGHDAPLFFQHSWVNWHKRAMSPFTQIKDHTPLSQADKLEEVDAESRILLTSEKIRKIVNLIPGDWVEWRGRNETPQNIYDIYYQFLIERVGHSETFVREAKHAREAYS